MLKTMKRALTRGRMEIRRCRTHVIAFALSAGLSLGFMTSAASANLVAYWNFNALTAPVPDNIAADVGSGNVDLSNWGGTQIVNSPAGGASPFQAGTDLNALFGDPPGNALGLRGTAGNSTGVDFEFSMDGLQDLTVSYATWRNQAGFTSQTWSWSVDGTTFTQLGVISLAAPLIWQLAELDFSAITQLNDADAVSLRVVFAGASGPPVAVATNLLDNIQINANAIPAPGALALLMLAACSGGVRRRRSA